MLAHSLAPPGVVETSDRNIVANSVVGLRTVRPDALAPICPWAHRESNLHPSGTYERLEERSRRDLPLLERNLPLADAAEPNALRIHRNKGDPTKLEPCARFALNDRSCETNLLSRVEDDLSTKDWHTIMASRTYARRWVTVLFNLCRAADFKEEGPVRNTIRMK